MYRSLDKGGQNKVVKLSSFYSYHISKLQNLVFQALVSKKKKISFSYLTRVS